jgi:hypothetical protein
LQNKLRLDKTDAELDALIAAVCEKMKATKQKNRLTFYWLKRPARRAFLFEALTNSLW